MAIQYYMRGYNISAPGAVGYVDWVVNDTPDSQATYVPAPYNSGNISNITVNKVVTSKVDNFLKPFESLTAIGGTGSDGYFFHLNSYDWLHATPPGPPIPVPSYLTGLSVVRGSSDGIIPRDYTTLFWAENALKWLFAYNTNGDGYTIGAALPVGMGSLSVDGYIEVGTNPAQSGIIRVSNNQFLVSRNSTNTDDGYLIGLDDVNRIRLGSPPANQIYIPGNLRVDGYVRDGSLIPSLSGFIRNGNGSNIITVRDIADGYDIVILSTDGSTNRVYLGDASNDGISYDVGLLREHIFNIDGSPFIHLGDLDGTSYIKFNETSPLPTITQYTRNIGSGHPLTFKAQDTTSPGDNGGFIVISSGSGPNADGYIDLSINKTPKMRIFGSTAPPVVDFTNNEIDNPDSIQILNPIIRFYNTTVNPSIIQDPIIGSDGQTFLILAQTVSGTLPNRIGGSLLLSSGASTANANDGYVRLQTGQIDRLFINAKDGYITQTLSVFAFNGLDGSFDSATVINPTIKQRDDITDSITGQLMTIQSQNTTGANTIGGSLNITSGQGTLADGYVRLQTGAVDRLLLDATNTQATLTLQYFSFNSSVVNPVIRQIEDTGDDFTGQLMTVQAQNILGSNTIGGSLTLTSGQGTLADGYLRLQTGGTTKLLIDGYNSEIIIGEIGDTTYIPGTLFIGTFNSSTDLLVEDRLIHANFNEAVAGPPVPPPSSITGLTVHRGDNGALTYNDEAGWIWVEGANLDASDGYWKAASVLAGDDTNLSNSLNIMARSLTVTDDPNIAAGVPTIGGLRTLNNSVAVSSRDFNNTLDLRLLGTDGYDRVIHGSSVDKGHIFDTAVDGYYDFRVNSVPSAFIDGYKFAFKVGRRRHITPVVGTYNILDTDDFLAIDSSTAYVVTLPTSPTLGDTYEFKDINGTASVNNVTIDGNGNNIDGISSLVINTNFAALVVTYTGAQWSVS